MLLKCVIACALVACLVPQTGATANAQPAAKPAPATKPQAPGPPPVATTKPQAPGPPPVATPAAATPPATSQVYCGHTPNKILTCLDDPKVVNPVVVKKCNRPLSQCDKIKCIFRGSGWSTPSATKDDKINKEKLKEHFDFYALEKPEWAAAVQHLKAACVDKELPAQGVAQNCAAYDVFHCIQTSFLRNASPLQWRNSTDCAYPRAFAASCPVCPDDCFAAQVPVGTCNACLSLPRTP